MKKRLDELLVEQGHVATRSRARDAIVRGLVRVDGEVVTKPGAFPPAAARLTVAPEAGTGYVSRGALKLVAALDAFGFDPAGRTCLDAGASTGGFTEVLLERGASRIYAVDVGKGQLHPRVASRIEVTSLEGPEVRSLDRSLIDEAVTAIVADVSFISLEKVLPSLLTFAAPGCWFVALVKPQFEVGRDAIGKGGIVKDEIARAAAVAAIETLIATTSDWHVAGLIQSPIPRRFGKRRISDWSAPRWLKPKTSSSRGLAERATASHAPPKATDSFPALYPASAGLSRTAKKPPDWPTVPTGCLRRAAT